MKNSLIIYETYYGTARKVSDIFSKVIGNAKFLEVDEAKEDLSNYENIFLVFAFHGYDTAKKIKQYLKSVKDEMKTKKIGLIGVGLQESDMKNYSEPICKVLERKVDYIEFIEGELRVNKLTEEDKVTLKNFLGNLKMKLMDMGKFRKEDVCDLGYKYRKIIMEPENKANDKEVLESIEEFLSNHNTCSLATGDGKNIRVTPIEYIYYENKFYFLTEGGLKFNGIIKNQKVAICVYDEYTGMNNLKGLQVNGNTEMVEIGSEEYKKVLSIKKLTYENIKKLSITLNMIKVHVNRYEFLNSDFRKIGYDALQVIK